MNYLEKVKELYPEKLSGDLEGHWWYAPSDYSPMIEAFGEVLIREDQDDYHGDSWVLYQKEERLGFLNFGWGSCSGCDALQACDSVEDIAGLMGELNDRIKWFDTKQEALAYFENHDWEGDYCFSSDEFKTFLASALEYLKQE